MDWILELKLELERDNEIKALEFELDYMLLTLHDVMMRDDRKDISIVKNRLTEICSELNDLYNY